MAVNSEHNRLVDDYLNGNLSGSEKEIFEGQLSSNPNLKSELNHQSELIEGIESFRKTELKTRLAAINLTPTILGIVSQSVAIKTAVTVATVSIIGAGIYFYNSSSFLLQRVDAISDYTLSETHLPDPIENIRPIEKIESRDIPKNFNNAKSIEHVVIKKKRISKTATSNSIDFKVPLSPNTAEENINPEPEEIAENVNGLEEIADVGTFDKVDVESIIDRKHKFHYKYTNGKLYLYGKFDKSPYEIIEINARKDKRLFFFYQDSYYRIEKNTSDITAFKVIEDSELIQELNIIKLKQ